MPNLSRRNLILGATGGGLLGAAGFFGGSQLVHAAEGLPLKIVNNTGRWKNDDIWVHVVGTELASGRMGCLKKNGTFARSALSDNRSDGFARYGIRLSELRTLPLAALSGRVYISMGKQLKFKVVGTGNGVGLQYPAGWVKSDPSYKTLHDFMEFTNNDAGFYCNTTMVDMFGLPMFITLNGKSIARYEEGARGRIFEQMRKRPAFRRLVVGNLRVIAPGHGLDRGIFSPNYLDPYINGRWKQYESQTLTVVANNVTYRGKVESGRLVFRQGNAVKASFAKPSTRDVLFCDGTLAAPNDGVGGPIAAVVAAGLNRGVLHRPKQPTVKPGLYYKRPRTNHYSRILHENTVDGKAYGFAFDDVVSHASYIENGSPKNVTLTLQPF